MVHPITLTTAMTMEKAKAGALTATTLAPTPTNIMARDEQQQLYQFHAQD